MMFFKQLGLLSVFLASFQLNSFAQTDQIDVTASVQNGDTTLIRYLRSAVVTAERDRSYRNTWKYKRIVKRVKRVLPYAHLGAELYTNYKDQENTFEKNREKRKFLKSEEKRLKSKFEGKIRNLTVNDGIVLVKLIDRQTTYTSYEILKELRGGTSAFLWQGVARLFDSSLKHQYNPNGEDWMIEEIIGRINAGEI